MKRSVIPALLFAASLAPTVAHAQTAAVNVPPREPGIVGPTPTNPPDTGLGTTHGTHPVVAPTATTTSAPSASVGATPAAPSTTLVVPTRSLAPATRVPPPAPSGARADLPASLTPRAGGLTADSAAGRALQNSASV